MAMSIFDLIECLGMALMAAWMIAA
jgi:hypothetical protein